MITEELQIKLYERLGGLIRNERMKADVKQELLSDYLNMSRVSISNIELGKTRIQVHTLIEIIKYLKIDLKAILCPLFDLLADEVTNEEEKRIAPGVDAPKYMEFKNSDDLSKVKEFVHFLKIKNLSSNNSK